MPEYYDPDYDEKYEAEVMGSSVDELQNAVIGRRIVSVQKAKYPATVYGRGEGVELTLDDGTRVLVADTDDCCAYTQVEDFKFLEGVENAITSVNADKDFNKWFIYAGNAPVLEMDVAWSPGNPYYYGFGFEIRVEKEGR
jgi:hypothetical protein